MRFWLLALVWLPAGVVAVTLVRFGTTAGFAMHPADLPMAAASLALVAPCGLPLALGCRKLWRLVGGRPARLRHHRIDHHCGPARAGGHRTLCGVPQPAGLGRSMVLGPTGLSAAGHRPISIRGIPPSQSIWLRNSCVRGSLASVKNVAGGPCSTMTPRSVK